MRVRRLRLAQVRMTSALTRGLTRFDVVSSFIRRARKWPLIRQAADFVAGYNRVFPDLAAAQKCATWYGEQGHDSPASARGLRADMAATRPCDYPALLHLAQLPLSGMRIFDFGGTAGELFYLYDRYLNFPANLLWTVHDLPGHMRCGRDIARQRGESRVQFADDSNSAAGADVLLISGALHYLPFSLETLLAGLSPPPRRILINRTPLVDEPTAATVQYVGGVMVACKLINRVELVASVEALGYRLVDSWRVPELSIKLPYDPAYWVHEYSGVYFRGNA